MQLSTGMYTYIQVMTCMRRPEDNLWGQFSSSAMWDPGNELRSSGLAAGALTPELLAGPEDFSF